MNPSLLRPGLAALCALAALATGRGEPTQPPRPPSRAVVTISVTPPITATTTGPAGYARWSDLKDYTFAQRDTLLAGLTSLVSRVDAQAAELKAKRDAMAATTRTADWDFAMKEVHNARATLRFACEELGKATPETWGQQRERVGQAWVRTQNAYSSVKSSTTM